MKTRALMTALAATLGLCLGSDARADLTLNVGGGLVTFDGSGSGASLSFTGFHISSDPGGDKDAVGFAGNLTGSYSYSVAGISSSSPFQTATLTPGSQSEIAITDGAGTPQTLTASITGMSITTLVLGPTFGSASGMIALGDVTYKGTSADLLALKNGANSGDGRIQLNFQFTNAESLTQLAQKGATNTTSYSGEFSVIGPEPSSMAMAVVGALGLIGYGLHLRKKRPSPLD